MKINYQGFRSATQEEEVRSLLEEFHDMIPRKVLNLTVVNWDTDELGFSEAAVEYDSSYLICTIHIYNRFFANTTEKKREILIHEIVHLHTAEYFNVVRDDILEYVKEHNEPLAEHFRRAAVAAEELLVSQVAHFISEQSCGSKRN